MVRSDYNTVRMHKQKWNTHVFQFSLIIEGTTEKVYNFYTPFSQPQARQYPKTCIFTVTKCFCNGTVHFKNVNNHLNTDIYSYLETSGGQSSNQYLIAVNFFNTSVN